MPQSADVLCVESAGDVLLNVLFPIICQHVL